MFSNWSMKVRIKPERNFNYTSFKVQQKVWYGWKTIYVSDILKYTLEFVEELKQIAEVEFRKM